MRVLIDLLHPAHVHVFKHFCAEIAARGDQVLVTARNKDVTVPLLRSLNIDHDVISTQRDGAFGLVVELLARTRRLKRIADTWQPDVLIGVMGPSIAIVGKLTNTPAFVLYDTEIAKATNRWVYPIAEAVITPDCYQGSVHGRHVTHPSYHELAYLHPDRFAPDAGKLEPFGLDPSVPYSIARFVSWNASHDRNLRGLSTDDQRRIIGALAEHGEVRVSSEIPLAPDLEQFRLRGPIVDVHHVLAHATCFVGESATMASEAAVVGTPSYYIAEKSRGYLDDLALRGLVAKYHPHETLRLLADLHALTPVTPRMRRAYAQLLQDKVDLTSWLIDWLDGETLGSDGSARR